MFARVSMNVNECKRVCNITKSVKFKKITQTDIQTETMSVESLYHFPLLHSRKWYFLYTIVICMFPSLVYNMGVSPLQNYWIRHCTQQSMNNVCRHPHKLTHTYDHRIQNAWIIRFRTSRNFEHSKLSWALPCLNRSKASAIVLSTKRIIFKIVTHRS